MLYVMQSELPSAPAHSMWNHEEIKDHANEWYGLSVLGLCRCSLYLQGGTQTPWYF